MTCSMDGSDRVESIEVGAIDAGTVATARTDVASVQLDGEIVLYDDSSHRLHRLNPTAATLWQCLDGSASLAEIGTDIAGVYSVPAATVIPQIVTLAQSFAEEGLLVGFEKERDRPNGPESEDPDQDDARFVAEAPSPCMDPNFRLGERGTMTVRAGERVLGLRASTVELAQAAHAVLAPALVPGIAAPPNVSIVETKAGAGRPIYFCYRSGWLVTRARSIRQAIATACVLLSSYGEDCSAGLVRVESIVAVRVGSATLFGPETRNVLAGLVPRLHSAGWRISDHPWALLRPDGASVLVPPLSFAIDEPALARLPCHKSDTAQPEPGDYPVAAWVAPAPPNRDVSTLAGRIAQVAQGSPDLGRDALVVLDTVRSLLQQAAWKVSTAFDAASLARMAEV